MGRTKNIKSFIRFSFIFGHALAICFLLDHLITPSTVILLVLQLAVIIIAFQCGTQYAYMAIFLEATSFSFFFAHSRYSLHIVHATDIINLTFFILVALIANKLVEKYKIRQKSLGQVQLRNRILLSVSHDFRTPLSTIIGTLTTLNVYKENLTKIQVSALLDSAIMESHHFYQYIENLQQATKIQNHTLKFEKFELSIVEVIFRVIKFFPHSRHRILFENNEFIPLLRINNNLIEQAIFNILNNSLRYPSSGKNVTIILSYLNGKILIDIYDENMNISLEQSKYIFELFYSAQKLNQNDSGIGLGYAVAKGIVKSHKGTIEAIPFESGCLFRIILPLV